jgi:hypothetical protein
MQKLISFLLPVFLSIVLVGAAPDKVFSQTRQHQTADTVNSKEAPYVRGITPARAKSLVGGILGLASVIIGWRVKSRKATATRGGRLWCFASLTLGILAMLLGALHLSTVTGGFGTGGGKAGAIVAIALGFVGAGISGMALGFNKNRQA